MHNKNRAKNIELLAMLRDCESYARAMAMLHGSGESAQVSSRCRELIAKMEDKNEYAKVPFEIKPLGPFYPNEKGGDEETSVHIKMLQEISEKNCPDEVKLRNIAKILLAIGSLWAFAVERKPENTEITNEKTEDEIIKILKWFKEESQIEYVIESDGFTKLEIDISNVINVHFLEPKTHPQTVALALAGMIPSLLETLTWKPKNIRNAIKSAEETIRYLQNN